MLVLCSLICTMDHTIHSKNDLPGKRDINDDDSECRDRQTVKISEPYASHWGGDA